MLKVEEKKRKIFVDDEIVEISTSRRQDIQSTVVKCIMQSGRSTTELNARC